MREIAQATEGTILRPRRSRPGALVPGLRRKQGIEIKTRRALSSRATLQEASRQARLERCHATSSCTRASRSYQGATDLRFICIKTDNVVLGSRRLKNRDLLAQNTLQQDSTTKQNIHNSIALHHHFHSQTAEPTIGNSGPYIPQTIQARIPQYIYRSYYCSRLNYYG
jgi:hypothetical protein